MLTRTGAPGSLGASAPAEPAVSRLMPGRTGRLGPAFGESAVPGTLTGRHTEDIAVHTGSGFAGIATPHIDSAELAVSWLVRGRTGCLGSAFGELAVSWCPW